MYDNSLDERTLEMAAKYICTMLDGLCPMVVEKTSCLTTCDLDTLPWQCWIDHFREKARAAQDKQAMAGGCKGNSSEAQPNRPVM